MFRRILCVEHREGGQRDVAEEGQAPHRILPHTWVRMYQYEQRTAENQSCARN